MVSSTRKEVSVFDKSMVMSVFCSSRMTQHKKWFQTTIRRVSWLLLLSEAFAPNRPSNILLNFNL